MGVKYKYPGEAEVRIERANDYRLVSADNPSKPNAYIAVGSYTDVLSGEAKGLIVGISQPSFFTLTTSDFVRNNEQISSGRTLPTGETLRNVRKWRYEIPSLGIINGSYFFKNESAVEIKNLYQAGFDEFGVVPFNSSPNGTSANIFGELHYGREWYFGVDTGNDIYISENPIITNIYPARFVREYHLEIYLGETTIFERWNDVPPEYVEIYSNCPEGTCEVICPGGICCYGSDGIAVTSIELEEA